MSFLHEFIFPNTKSRPVCQSQDGLTACLTGWPGLNQVLMSPHHASCLEWTLQGIQWGSGLQRPVVSELIKEKVRV